MKRFNVIRESKFEKLTNEDLIKIKGGTTICLNCMKRQKKHAWKLVLPGPEISSTYDDFTLE